MNIKTIENILTDWNDINCIHGLILDKYDITREQEFAITLCSYGMTAEEIAIKLVGLRSGMKSSEILEVMRS